MFRATNKNVRHLVGTYFFFYYLTVPTSYPPDHFSIVSTTYERSKLFKVPVPIKRHFVTRKFRLAIDIRCCSFLTTLTDYN